MYKLIFINDSKSEEIGYFDTEVEVNKKMFSHITSRNEKSYYCRFWIDEEGTWIDYGSHTRFYLIQKII